MTTFDRLIAENPVTVDYIAHTLARIPRYAGRWNRPVTVARHSLNLVKYLKRCTYETQLQALMHDATEAWTGDIISPVKDMLWVSTGKPGELISYLSFERRLLKNIFGELDIPWPVGLAVTTADRLAIGEESHACCAPHYRGLSRWTIRKDKQDFKAVYARLWLRAHRTSGTGDIAVTRDGVRVELVQQSHVVGVVGGRCHRAT